MVARGKGAREDKGKQLAWDSGGTGTKGGHGKRGWGVRPSITA